MIYCKYFAIVTRVIEVRRMICACKEANVLDNTDAKLLTALQKNAQLTAYELGELLHLSSSQASRRRQRLEAAGYIKGYRAQLSAGKLGLHVEAFVQVTTATHAPDIAARFMAHLKTLPEVTDVWTLTGEADYLLRVFCKDLKALNRLVHQSLLPHDAVARVQSQIVMDNIKTGAPLPVAPVKIS